jgi:hypothetical protein
MELKYNISNKEMIDIEENHSPSPHSSPSSPTQSKFKKFNSHDGQLVSMYEKIDGRKLRYILDHVDELGIDKVTGHTTDKDLDGQITILKKYLKKSKNGKIKVGYNQPRNVGRYFAKGGQSLQNISRRIRNTISGNFYNDIDMVNAHPTLLSHYLTKNNIPHDNLKLYIKDRENYLKNLNIPDRNDAKTIILSILNGGCNRNIKERCLHSTMLANFNNEMAVVRTKIMDLEPDIVTMCKQKKKERKKSDWNLGGSVVNTILCDLENRTLICMVNFFKSKKIRTGVFVFDGIMVEKNDKVPITQDLLDECSTCIKQELGISMNLLEKPMDKVYDIGETDYTDYTTIKKDFEEYNFKCISDSSFYNTDFGRINVRNKTDLLVAYEHLNYITIDGKDDCFISAWLRDPEIRSYQFVDFIPRPLHVPDHTYNTWNGFEVEKWSDEEVDDVDGKDGKDDVANSHLKFILNHIKMLCNNDDGSFDYIIKWFAHLFQYPGLKNNIAVLFKTLPGMGKDLFFLILCTMIGDKFCGNTTQVERDVFGQFNGFLKDKLLVVLNEMSGSIGFKYNDKLKDLITAKMSKINDKNTKCKDVTSFLHLMFFTNNGFPVKIENGERRCVVLENLNSPPDKKYFDTLLTIVDHKPTLKLFYNYLMKIDLSKINWIADRPQNEFMDDLRTIAREKELSCIIDYIVDKQSREMLIISARDLFELFKSYCSDSAYKTNPIKFGIKVKKLGIDGWTVKRTMKSNVYIFDTKKCINWFIAKKHLPADYLSLQDNHIKLL